MRPEGLPVTRKAPLWHRLLGGQRLRMAAYVAGPGPRGRGDRRRRVLIISYAHRVYAQTPHHPERDGAHADRVAPPSELGTRLTSETVANAPFIDGFAAGAGTCRPAAPSRLNTYGFSQSILIVSRPCL